MSSKVNSLDDKELSSTENQISLDDSLNLLDRLERINRRLSMEGVLIVIFTTTHIACALFLMFNRYFHYNMEFDINPAGMLIIETVSFFGSLLLLLCYDRLRKKGDVIFEEISDEFQWYIRKGNYVNVKEGTPQEGPALRARVLLRTFATTANLPLAPGKYGPGIYFLINAGLAILVAVVLTR